MWYIKFQSSIITNWIITNIPDLPNPNYFCQYSKQPMSIFSAFWPDFFEDAPTIKTKQCQRTIFVSIIHLVRIVYELTFSIIQIHTGTQMPLFCLHVLKSFSIEDCRTLSPKQCNVRAAFTDADVSFLERLLSGRSLFPWFRVTFLLFTGFAQPLSFEIKPATSEDG